MGAWCRSWNGADGEKEFKLWRKQRYLHSLATEREAEAAGPPEYISGEGRD